MRTDVFTVFSIGIEPTSEHVLLFWKELHVITQNITASKWMVSQSLRGMHDAVLLQDISEKGGGTEKFSLPVMN